MRTRSLQRTDLQAGSFEQRAYLACFQLSASDNTRRAYWNDCRHWLEFVRARGLNPIAPGPVAVVAWMESMKAQELASKTRARRVAALASIYKRLVREGVLEANPFSPETGPEREIGIAETPTPIASPESVRKLIATLDKDRSFEGLRDAAIVRVLWATGARRSTLTEMTFERLTRDHDAFVMTLPAKGRTTVRILIRGKAALALDAYLKALPLRTGPIWRFTAKDKKLRPAIDKDVWRMVTRRAKKAGVDEPISPHTFRVAFLTLNPASLEAKQDAAGHADPATTRIYDRASWRGREAFEQMPEIEES